MFQPYVFKKPDTSTFDQKKFLISYFKKKNKILNILTICLLNILLVNTNAYAGQLIDKSSDGYFLYLPQAALSGKPSPVLVCFPAEGILAKQDISAWRLPAEKNNFIVIDFDINYNSIKSPPNVKSLHKRIQKTIDTLSSSYPLDTQRIYIAGTSSGGMISIALALMNPNRFIAVGIISGARLAFVDWVTLTFGGSQKHKRNAKAIDFYMLHGEKDKMIPIQEFHFTVKQLREHGDTVEFDIIQEGTHILPSHVYRKTVDWLSNKKR